MLIAIDASRAVREEPTGTELYSARVIQYLAKIDTENTYFLYTPTPPPANFGKLPDNFHWRVIPMKRLWTQIRLSIALALDKPDLLFVPAHVLPLFTPKKTVVTLHDVAYEIFPKAYNWFARWYNRYAMRLAGVHATRIITPSEATKKDLIRIYGIDGQKITPIHLGFDDRFAEKVPAPKEVKDLGDYFLMLGRLEDRKNTVNAVRAFQKFRENDEKSNAKLVLIGKPGYGYEHVEAVIAALPRPIQKDVILPGYLDNETVAAYMQNAVAYLSPTLYEGFGITVLEAMAAGTPVITSDVSSIPEVVGDAAVLVNPESVEEIAKAMAVVSSDLSRDELAKKGKEQAKQFSWDKMAKETLKVLKEAA